MSWLFDGAEEIRRKLERGQSFGLSKDQYGALAHVAMGALRMAGVEPAEIRLLADEPGCDVILYGQNYVYTVRMQPRKARTSLFALPLDSKLGGCGVSLCRRTSSGNRISSVISLRRFSGMKASTS